MTHCEIRHCSLVADEAEVEQAAQDGGGAPLPDGEALAHDAVAVRDEHEGDEGGRLEEDPRHVRAERHPQRARLQVHARVPAQQQRRLDSAFGKISQEALGEGSRDASVGLNKLKRLVRVLTRTGTRAPFGAL